MPRPPRVLLALLACVLLLTTGAAAGCGDDEREKPPAAGTPEETGGEQGTGCEPAEKPAARTVELAKPKRRLERDKRYVATVATNCGSFAITLDARRAPRTGGSFKYLADKGFFDGLPFHRIVPGFVIQGGDPQGDGTGGPGYTVVEAPPPSLEYLKGVVAMAKGQLDEPGTSGSQFFVVTGEDAELTADYALLGRVSAGQDVVDKIGVAPVGADEQPVEPIVIESVKVAEQ